MTADASPPPGWGPLFRTSPLIQHLGGFASRGRGDALQLGLRVLPHLRAGDRIVARMRAVFVDRSQA